MKRFSSLIVLITFFFSSFSSYPVFANLPQPGTMLMPSGEASLPVLKGLKLDPNDPLHMQFIIDPGTNKTVDKDQANQLIRYFLAALATPAQDIWVNLSPYEKERIMEDNLSYTDLGKAMLEQDYLLKQLAASLTYPETEIGKKYWEAINGVGANNHSPANNSFNKVWISARESEVYEGTNTVVITKASLKALTDQDYLAIQNNSERERPLTPSLTKRGDDTLALVKRGPAVAGESSGVGAFKQHILPQIETELNTGKNFANLRQIYNAVILASWFKNKFKESFFKYYLNQKNINGIALNDKTSKEKIFNLYVQAFQKGAYNYVKRELPLTPSLAKRGFATKITKRAYFSGGIQPNMGLPPTGPVSAPSLAAAVDNGGDVVADLRFSAESSAKEAEAAYLVQQLKIYFIARLAAMPADDKLYLAALKILDARTGLDDKTLIGEVDISEALGLPEKSVTVPINIGMGGTPAYAASKGVPRSPASLEKIGFGNRLQRAEYSQIWLPGLKKSFMHDPWSTGAMIATAFDTSVRHVYFNGTAKDYGHLEISWRAWAQKKRWQKLDIVAVDFDNGVHLNIRFSEKAMLIDFPAGQRHYADRLYAIIMALAAAEPELTAKPDVTASLGPIEAEVTKNAARLRYLLQHQLSKFMTALHEVDADLHLAEASGGLLISMPDAQMQGYFASYGAKKDMAVRLASRNSGGVTLIFTRTSAGQEVVDMDWLASPHERRAITLALGHALNPESNPVVVGIDPVSQALSKMERFGFLGDHSRKTLDESLAAAMQSLENNLRAGIDPHHVQDYDYRGLRILLQLAQAIDEDGKTFAGWDGFDTRLRGILLGLQRFKYHGPEESYFSGVNSAIDLLERWAKSGVKRGKLWNALKRYRTIQKNELVYLTAQCDHWGVPRALAELAYGGTQEYSLEAGIIAEPDQMVELAARVIKAVGQASEQLDTYGLKIPGLNHDRTWQVLLFKDFNTRAQQIQNAPKLPVELALYARQAAYDINAAIRKLDSKANIPLIERVRAGESLQQIYSTFSVLRFVNKGKPHENAFDPEMTAKNLQQLALFPYFGGNTKNNLIGALRQELDQLTAQSAPLRRFVAALGGGNNSKGKEVTRDYDIIEQSLRETIDALEKAQGQWEQVDHGLREMYPKLDTQLNSQERATLIWWIMVNQKASEGSAPHIEMADAYPKVLLDQDIPALAVYDVRGLLMAGRSGGKAAASRGGTTKRSKVTPSVTALAVTAGEKSLEQSGLTVSNGQLKVSGDVAKYAPVLAPLPVLDSDTRTAREQAAKHDATLLGLAQVSPAVAQVVAKGMQKELGGGNIRDREQFLIEALRRGQSGLAIDALRSTYQRRKADDSAEKLIAADIKTVDKLETHLSRAMMYLAAAQAMSKDGLEQINVGGKIFTRQELWQKAWQEACDKDLYFNHLSTAACLAIARAAAGHNQLPLLIALLKTADYEKIGLEVLAVVQAAAEYEQWGNMQKALEFIKKDDDIPVDRGESLYRAINDVMLETIARKNYTAAAEVLRAARCLGHFHRGYREQLFLTFAVYLGEAGQWKTIQENMEILSAASSSSILAEAMYYLGVNQFDLADGVVTIRNVLEGAMDHAVEAMTTSGSHEESEGFLHIARVAAKVGLIDIMHEALEKFRVHLCGNKNFDEAIIADLARGGYWQDAWQEIDHIIDMLGRSDENEKARCYAALAALMERYGVDEAEGGVSRESALANAIKALDGSAIASIGARYRAWRMVSVAWHKMQQEKKQEFSRYYAALGDIAAAMHEAGVEQIRLSDGVLTRQEVEELIKETGKHNISRLRLAHRLADLGLWGPVRDIVKDGWKELYDSDAERVDNLVLLAALAGEGEVAQKALGSFSDERLIVHAVWVRAQVGDVIADNILYSPVLSKIKARLQSAAQQGKITVNPGQIDILAQRVLTAVKAIGLRAKGRFSPAAGELVGLSDLRAQKDGFPVANGDLRRLFKPVIDELLYGPGSGMAPTPALPSGSQSVPASVDVSGHGESNDGGIAWANVAASAQGQGKFYFTRIPTTAEIKKVFDNVSFTVVALKENQSLREFAGLAK